MSTGEPRESGKEACKGAKAGKHGVKAGKSSVKSESRV